MNERYLKDFESALDILKHILRNADDKIAFKMQEPYLELLDIYEDCLQSED